MDSQEYLTTPEPILIDVLLDKRSVDANRRTDHRSARTEQRTVADLGVGLMESLGYTEFAVQGGDIGAGIGSRMALQHPEKILGLHLNYIPGSYKPASELRENSTGEMAAYRRNAELWSRTEGAYSLQQATRPDTLAYGLNDSPIGLCAWILEKLHAWSAAVPGSELPFSLDEILGSFTLYWLMRTIASSVRIYRENAMIPLHLKESERIGVPVAFAHFPGEMPMPPQAYVELGYNIVQWTEMPRGGVTLRPWRSSACWLMTSGHSSPRSRSILLRDALG